MSYGRVPDRDEVIAATKDELQKCEQESRQRDLNGFSFTPKGSETPIWVKYSHMSEEMRCEANTQAYVRDELLKRDDLKGMFYIPQVFDWIDTEIDGLEYGLIVMEYITGTDMKRVLRDLEYIERPSTKPDRLCSTEFVPIESEENKKKASMFRDKIADFICFLLSLTPEPDASPGPYGGGRIKNQIFGRDGKEDAVAPRDFDTLQDLQDYINNYIESSPRNQPERVDLMPEGLKMCWCDLHYSNFIMKEPKDPSTPMTIIDFEFACWMPYSALVWALLVKGATYPREEYVTDRILRQANLEIKWDNMDAFDLLSSIHGQ